MVEMTLSLQVDLVLSDVHPPMRHNLFNWCCHFAYCDAAMWLKCVRHPKNAIFTQNFAMSAIPEGPTIINIYSLVSCLTESVSSY